MHSIDMRVTRIGVFSDVHDNLLALKKMLAVMRDQGIEVLLFGGDFCSPIVALEMVKFNGQIHAVFGNGDGDRFKIAEIAAKNPGRLVLHGEHAELEIVGHKVAMAHYPLYGQALARTGDYSLVVSGHTHERRVETLGDTLWLNPGELMGWKSTPKCSIYDLTTGQEVCIDLP